MIKFIALGKYVALLIVAFLAGFNSSIAQTYITIGGNDLSSASTAINRSWNATPTLVSNYNCAEILYTNTELNIPAGNVSIDKLAFNKTGGSTSNSYQYNTTNVSIYMKTVSTTSLTNGTYDLGSYTLVWSGNFPSGGAFGFKEVDFSTIFQYPNGANDHLSILVLNNSGIVPINNTTDRPEWACNTVTGSDIKSRFNSSNVSLPTFGNSSTTRPQIKLRYSICSAPPAILGPILGNSNSICAGGGDNYSVYNPEVGVTYTWSYSGNATITDNGNATTIGAGSAIQLTNVTSAGVLTVTPSNYCGTSPAETRNIDVIPVANLTPPSVSPICEGQSFTLGCPVDGYFGSWSPAYNNTITTTYIFTPSAGQCASNGIVTVVVIPNVIPTFLQVQPICLGQTIVPLPTTSDNGITGSWSPSINNTATTTYTFTPTSGQCAYPTTMTIVVNPIITPSFIQVSAICAGASLSLPQISTNGVNGTWNPALDNTQTTTYSFIPNPGQCANMGTLTVVVNPNPAIPIISANGSLIFCEGENVVLTSSEPTGNLWSNASTTQSISVNSSGDYNVEYTDANGCSATSLPTTVTVNPTPSIPTISANGPITFCAGGSVVLTSSEPTGNLWSDGSSTQSITVNSSGNYAVSFTDINGCTSNSSLIPVIVNSVPAANVFMLTNDTITALPVGQNYQWINCANDVPIFGANDVNYGVEVNGDYAVIVSNSDGCVDTSYCVAVNLPFLDPDAGLIIFPNPTTGNFSVSINTDQFVDVIEISFLNSVGNIISTQTTQAGSGVQIINFANNQLQAGLYLIVVSDQNGNQLTGNVLIQ